MGADRRPGATGRPRETGPGSRSGMAFLPSFLLVLRQNLYHFEGFVCTTLCVIICFQTVPHPNREAPANVGRFCEWASRVFGFRKVFLPAAPLRSECHRVPSTAPALWGQTC